MLRGLYLARNLNILLVVGGLVLSDWIKRRKSFEDSNTMEIAEGPLGEVI